MIISGSGHRLQGLFGYDLSHPGYAYIEKELIKKLEEVKPDKVISGGANGFDQILLEVAIRMQIPTVVAVPFKGQESNWPESSQIKYKELLDKASEVVIVSLGGYANWKMQARNIYLADNCDLIIACFSGRPGGTANCLQYAKSINKEIFIINPNYWNKEEEKCQEQLESVILVGKKK